jgi:hypothetical protein
VAAALGEVAEGGWGALGPEKPWRNAENGAILLPCNLEVRYPQTYTHEHTHTHTHTKRSRAHTYRQNFRAHTHTSQFSVLYAEILMYHIMPTQIHTIE